MKLVTITRAEPEGQPRIDLIEDARLQIAFPSGDGIFIRPDDWRELNRRVEQVLTAVVAP